MRHHLLWALLLALAPTVCAAQATSPASPPATAPSSSPTQATAPAAPSSGYIYAGECKSCHPAEYAAWSKTKHAHTLDRLSEDERKPGTRCVSCHVTGTDAIETNGEVVNPNVQCESCHGPGKAHADAARAGANTVPLANAPEERTCVKCHNDTSPHFRGFFYSAFKGLVHKH